MTKQVYGNGFPTPSATTAATLCRIVRLPNDTAFLSVLMGALSLLENPDNWQELGDMSPDESASAFMDIIYDMYQNNYCSLDVPAPYWDDGTDVDAIAPVGEQHWYGELVPVEVGFSLLSEDDPELTFVDNLGIWLIAGFIAYAGQPGAAIAFIPFAQRFTLAFKSGNAGAIVRVLFDGLHLADIDTYGVEDEIISYTVEVPEEMSLSVGTLWIEHSGEHNPLAEPNEDDQYTISVVRKRLDEEQMPTILRQNPDNSCQLQQSIDAGETWTLAFDYSLCLPPAQQTILDTVINNNTWVSSFSPTVTFINQPGYTDEQTANAYAALCYACRAVVSAMFQAAYKAAQDEITAETITAVGLGIAAAVLDFFDIVTFGTITPLALAITSAALGLIAYIQALDASVWTDEDNKTAMACLMIQNLQAKGVSQENFQTAFDNTDCLSSGLQAIADVLARMLRFPATAERMYINFLNAVGNSNAAAQSVGMTNECICGETWQYIWDFNQPEDAAKFTVDTAFQRNPPQTTIYNPDCGFTNESAAYYDVCNPDIGAVGAAVYIDIYIPEGSEVTEIIFYANYNRYLSFRIDDADCDEDSGSGTWNAVTTIGAGWHKFGFQATSNSESAGFTTLRGVGIGGNGINPLAPCSVTPSVNTGSC